MSVVRGDYWIRGIGCPFASNDPNLNKWIEESVEQLERQRSRLGPPAKISSNRKSSRYFYSCCIVIEVFALESCSAGIDDMLAVILDCMVKSGVIADKSPRYVQKITIAHCYPMEVYSGDKPISSVKIVVK